MVSGERPYMVDALLLAMLLAQATPAPHPEASPLKEITHVTARPPCTAMHDAIGPSVAALMENDVMLTQGIKVLQRRAHLDRLGPFMGGLHVENDVSKVVRNLDAISALLKESPDAAQTEDSDRNSIESLEQKIRLIADAEHAELNVLDGTVQASQTYWLMQAGNATGLMTTGPQPGADPSEPLTAMFAPVQPLGAMHIADAALSRAAAIVSRERSFTETLLPLAAECDVPVPPALPGPAVSPL
jgi:hypothetical protein